VQQAAAIHPSSSGNGHAPLSNGAGAVTAAAAFDARNYYGSNYVTAIKNQLNCGSCVAFGTCATAEVTAAFLRGQPGLQLNLSEQQLFSSTGPPRARRARTAGCPSTRTRRSRTRA